VRASSHLRLLNYVMIDPSSRAQHSEVRIMGLSNIIDSYSKRVTRKSVCPTAVMSCRKRNSVRFSKAILKRYFLKTIK
jgi:hypothetical protein